MLYKSPVQAIYNLMASCVFPSLRSLFRGWLVFRAKTALPAFRANSTSAAFPAMPAFRANSPSAAFPAMPAFRANSPSTAFPATPSFPALPAALAIILLVLCIAPPSSGQAEEPLDLPLRPGKIDYWNRVIPVIDDPLLTTEGEWLEYELRQSFPARRHLRTEEDGASLERVFESSGLVLIMETHRPYVYTGNLNNGWLEVRVDDEPVRTIQPLYEATEVVLYRDLPSRPRRVTVRHHHSADGGAGARIIGFRKLHEPSADLAFFLTAESGDLLVDARITVKREDATVRTIVQRNWMSGMIRLAGLPPGRGYSLHIEALGWESLVMDLPELHAGSERLMAPLHLMLDHALVTRGFLAPRLGYPAVRVPGDTLTIHFEQQSEDRPLVLEAIHWEQRVEQASRRILLWEGRADLSESQGLKVRLQLPSDPVYGLGDLVARVQGSGEYLRWRAPSSLQLRESYSGQPVFLTLGHLDNWGQYQGEYLEMFAEMANLIHPDAVLFSNEVHPAYTAGGLRNMQVPYLITIGNHAFGYEENASYLDGEGVRHPGPYLPLSISTGAIEQGYFHREPHYEWRNAANRAFDRWYGNPMGVMQLAPDIAILNYGWSWDPQYNAEAIRKARALFEPYRSSRIRVLNAYESEPPHDFLNHFGFALVHSAHAWPRAAQMHAENPSQARRFVHFSIDDGATTFVGKRTSDTFRVVRFENDRVHSLSYAGHEHLPWPLDRHRIAPLRLEKVPHHPQERELFRAQLINNYREAFESCRITWVLPRGTYRITGARLQDQWHSDDGHWTVLTLQADAPANSTQNIIAQRSPEP